MHSSNNGGGGANGGGANGGGGAQVYSFPVLKPADIFACIREMQIAVSEDEIRNCDVTAIRKVLEVFIENIMGITREEMSQPAFSGLSALNFPELHEESIPELTFFRTASKLMHACGVYDFCLKDIQTPTPKRVRRQLSALINFAKFREERMAAFGELSRETDQLLKHKAALLDENARLERELQELLSQAAAEEPAIQQVHEECEILESEINVLNRQQAVLRHEVGTSKARYSALRDQVASHQFNILESEAEITRLQGKIVNSPERVKKEISAIAVSLESSKEELAAMERRSRELHACSDTFARAEKETVKIIEFMEEIEEDMRKCKEAKERVKMQKRQIEENRAKAQDAVAHRKRTEKLLEQKRMQHEHEKEELLIKIQASEQALQAAQDELRQLETSESDAHQRIAANDAERRDWERRYREDEARYQKDLHEIQQMFRRLQTAVDFYNSEILAALQTPMEM
ncbi:TPA: hypothetical protein N0F65_003987 [Lagenidium giganteum]|uniref:Kinetochore protein NUF2 n=1 Tax=Lagenidium giganteum TaxID=4803 RepID=A0AAV2YYX3_9STRA|nr:TPA: hypothetical protein N0F65_003987 [Lagenidium giganteum]